MDIATFFGFIMGITGIVAAVIFNGGDFYDFLDAPSAMIVLGGTLAATFINFPLSDVFRVFIAAIDKRGLKFEVEIRVEGHTDNTPINTPKFPSNWELSSYRALNVVKYMSKTSGIAEKSFSALGYGEYRPLFPNDTFERRAANRRVEIFIDADVIKKTL